MLVELDWGKHVLMGFIEVSLGKALQLVRLVCNDHLARCQRHCNGSPPTFDMFRIGNLMPSYCRRAGSIVGAQ